MIVLDTNVLVRLITKDDVEQTRMAVALLSGDGPFWLGREAVLETGWALKSGYEYSREQVSRALHVLVGLDKLEVEEAVKVRAALHLHAQGLDLGDAMIRAFAPAGSRVATFDERFAKRAARRGDADVVLVADLLGSEE